MSEIQPKKLKAGAEILQALFETEDQPLAHAFNRWKLWQRWPEVVGEEFAQFTEPVGYQNGILYVWVKNSTWMQHFQMLKKQLIQSVDQRFQKGYAKEIRFTLDRKFVPEADEQTSTVKQNMKKISGKSL